MKVSVLLATTGRPEAAARCVQEVLATANRRIEVIAAVDACDATLERLAPLVDQLLYSEEYRGCSRAWNDALAVATGDHFVLAADDLHWSEGWLEAALAQMARFDGGWGLVGFNDGHWGDDLSTHYLVSRRFVLEVLGGVIAWEHYKHSFNDVEICERAKRAGRYAWCADARVAHRHWIFGERPQDDTDNRNLVEHATSQQVYQARLAADFPCDYEPAIVE